MIEVVPETGSTNTALIARLADTTLDEGYWLIADRQTAGRGRQGRAWSDGLGNFMGSTLVRLGAGDPPAPTLSLVAGVALHRALTALGLHAVRLKWPNDVLAGGAKLAGVLCERHRDAVVVGVGVNLADAPRLPDRPTTSAALLGCDVPRDRFAETLAEAFGGALAAWHDGAWPDLRRDWLARAHPLGTPIAVRSAQGLLSGTFAGLGDDGVALMRMAEGEITPIHAGDIDVTGGADALGD